MIACADVPIMPHSRETKGYIMSATTTKAPKAKTAVKTVKLSAVYATYAAKRDIDTTRAAKLVRARLRSNFAKVIELDPSIAKVKSKANDGNRWPAEISKALADFITA